MSREIKIRLWCRLDNKYYKGVDLEECTIREINDWEGDIEFFTGLHDKNGKEIYEGDRVRCWFGYSDTPEDCTEHIIEYCAENSDYPAFDLSPRVEVECNGISHFLCEGDFHLEVIGNIHEQESK